MDPKNEFELDVTMESKCHYKLRSSLKKRKSRNPLGSLDNTEATADTTLAPPLRRVSFAASNYVKPFMDDPEKNTIWDNTYEEEVNHTDSTKSENTNHTDVSEHKSQYTEITNVDVQKEYATNIYCDQGVKDMEVSCFDQTMINDVPKSVIRKDNLDFTPCILPNIDLKNTTELSKETSFNMELTCHWKNNILQPSVGHGEVSTSELPNSTVRQEQDMSMTYCLKKVDIQENQLPHTITSKTVCGKEKFISDHSEMEFTCAFPSNILETVKQHSETAAGIARDAKTDNKENIATGYIERELVPDQSGMDFTCAFPSNILETINQSKGTERDLKMPRDLNVDDKENLPYAKNCKVLLSDQSGMELTCAFPNSILETVNQSKGTENIHLTIVTETANQEDNENPYPINEKVFLPSQSGMEFTCAFPSNILETVKQHSETAAGIARDAKTDNKENIAIGYIEKDILVPDQSGMDFTCAFSSNILETVKQHSETAAGIARDAKTDNKENIATGYIERKLVPDQSGMDFTCAFPSNILETINQSKGTERDQKMPRDLNVDDKENLPYAKTCKVLLSDQSGMELTCAFPNSILETVNQSKGTENIHLTMVTETANQEDNENPYPINEKVFLPSQSGMEFTCTFPEDTIETLNSKGTVNYSSGDKENNIAIGYDKKNFLPDQSNTRTDLPNNILGVGNQSKRTENNSTVVNIKDKENILSVYAKEEKVLLPDQSKMEISYGASSKTSQKENPFNNIKNESIRIEVVEGIIQNKESVLSGNMMIACPSEVLRKKENSSFFQQSDMEYASLFSDKILDIPAQPKKSNSLKPIATRNNIENKTVLPDNYTKCLPTIVGNKEVFLPNQNQRLDTENYPMKNECSSSLPENEDECKIAFSSKFDSKEHSTPSSFLQVQQVCCKELTIPDNQPTDNFKIIHTASNNCEFKKASSLLGDDVKNLSTYNKPISVDSKVNTESIKLVKVRKFGNIPVAVDVTDISIDQSLPDLAKPLIDISRQHYGLKENTYTVSVGKAEKESIKVNENTFVHQKVDATQSDNVKSQKNLIYFNDCGENIIPKTQSWNPAGTPSDENMTSIIKRGSQRQSNLKGNNIDLVVAESIGITEPQKPDPEIFLSEKIKQNNSEVKSTNLSLNKYETCEKNNIVQEVYTPHYIKKTPFDVSETRSKNKENENAEGSIVEERSLIDNMDASILINSLSLHDEQEDKCVDVNFFPNEMHDASIQKEDQNHLVKELGRLNGPVTKVIYSEPMKVKPFNNEEFPSMQTLGMNMFNSTNIASMEDTQQLIQATFSKPSFIKTDSMLESTGNNELNKTNMSPIQNETLMVVSIFKKIYKKLIRFQFPPVNYEEIADSIQSHQEVRDQVEKLLLNFKSPEIYTFTLQERTKKMSLGDISCDGSSTDSFDVGEDNCNKSMLLESNLSLHDKIVNVCKRSNNLLKIEHFEGSSYIFSTVHECVFIYVLIHPEDGRVTESNAASALDDSMDILNHFLVKNILDKLKESTLKSYLGPYYDVLSLLDHICLTVDEIMEFSIEFLSLQKLHPSLRIQSDYGISWEILHSSPPIWWTIGLNMASVSKINPKSLQLESKWGQINEEHIKSILINVDEGVECLRSFISNVYEYFERTQLKYKLQEHS